MADTVKVDLEENSKFRVAYDLMRHIANYEDTPEKKTDRRAYFLKLYHQCHLAVVAGWDYESIKNESGE